ncbi:hypothetical protein RHGRI_034412 [Rhododendron griersonianum]|uniref:BURP domain-containing protein n=1 Tax=Rhododendron griersonianum TaxID=479676 RepID=A0AAV6I0I3_9ERIC|nr:hypothetical protein RHGRI_034412 [Rhododendron griersonianum]
MLKTGTNMPMPDIQDKMPKRSFLPRLISSKLPFSKISEMKRIFHAEENSSMASMLATAVSECERAPIVGETKLCVGSVEDMIDFSISVLGHNVVVRTMENIEGSNKDVMIGKVSAINSGKVTKSVSCHQSLFPYLLYYCHSVLKVRLYEADILDPKTKAKINHGVAICHVDTSSWSADHVAFMALDSGPGKIEISNDLPKPWFLLNKASPLTAVESATFFKLANDQNALANRLRSFCSLANLLCFPDLSPSLENHDNNIDSYPNYGNQPNVGDDVYEKYDQSNVGNDGFKYDKSSPANAFKYDKLSPANAFKYDKSNVGNDGFKYDKLNPANAFKRQIESRQSV